MTKRVGSGPSDGWWVPTEQLAAALKLFIAAWDAEHPAQAQHRIYEGYSPMPSQLTATRYLSDQTGMPMRAIRRILRVEQKHTTLTNADALLTAAEMPHALGNTVMPVPRPFLGNFPSQK